MAKMKYKAGNIYQARKHVRAPFKDFWHGILQKGNQTAIVASLNGARRNKYSNTFNPKTQTLTYIGEGLSGNQKISRGNRILLKVHATKDEIIVFFDLGDLLSPKHLYCAGQWKVISKSYRKIKSRKVYVFKLKPSNKTTSDVLQEGFQHKNKKFESDLLKFAVMRESLYANYKQILRARDSFAGEVGEYFSIQRLNKHFLNNKVIRLQSSFKNLDAVQVGTGKTFAIKTVSKLNTTTSNIWGDPSKKGIDFFVICILNQKKLRPSLVLLIRSSLIKSFLKKDKYQGSYKIQVSSRLVKKSVAI